MGKILTEHFKKFLNEKQDLKKNFRETDFEKYFYANEEEIKNNLKQYGWTISRLKDNDNYMDLANILDVDTRIVEKVDVEYWTNYLIDLLEDEDDD